MSATAPGKICIHCGQDCSAKARTKDPQGRYACKGCHERALEAARAQAQKVARPAAPAPAEDVPYDDGAMIAGLVDQVHIAEDAPAMAAMQTCHSCNASMPADAMICTTCGYNAQTGKRLKISKQTAGGEAAKAVAKGSAALVFAAVGASAGAIVGAIVWAIVSHGLHYEVGLIAWGIGLAAGFGAAVGARAYTSPITGMIAVAAAILGILAGKYIAFTADIDQIDRTLSEIRITDENVRVGMAYEIVEEFESAKKKMDWPRGKNADDAEHLNDFPKQVVAEVNTRWTKLGPEGQRRLRQEKETEIREMAQKFTASIRETGFADTFTLFDGLWAILAIGSAFSLGSGMAGSRDD